MDNKNYTRFVQKSIGCVFYLIIFDENQKKAFIVTMTTKTTPSKIKKGDMMKIVFDFYDDIEARFGPSKCEPRRISIHIDRAANPLGRYWEIEGVKHGKTYVATLPLFDSVVSNKTRVCFQYFQSMKSEYGKSCWMDFGVVVISMKRLLEIARTKKEESFSLRMHSIEDDKSLAHIVVKDFEIVDEKDGRNEKPASVSGAIGKNRELAPVVAVSNATKKFATSKEGELKAMNATDIFLRSSSTEGVAKNGTNNVVSSAYVDRTNDVSSSTFKSASLDLPYMTGNEINHRIESFFVSTDVNDEDDDDNDDDGFFDEEISFFEKKTLDDYITRYEREKKYFPERMVGGESVECPIYPSQFTFKDSQLYLPFFAYAFYAEPHVSDDFWQMALIVHAHRRGFPSLQAYTTVFLDEYITPVKTRAIHAMDLVAQYAQTMEYIPDQMIDPDTGKKTPIELFGDALHTLTGDCEDSSGAILQMFDNFVARSFDRNASPVLFEMQRLLKRYIPFLCIEGVTSSHAQNQNDITVSNITGAHAAIKCIPIGTFKRFVARWRPDHPLLNYDPPSSNGDASLDDVLPILYGEGTGMLNSGGECDPVGEENKSLRSFFYSSKDSKAAKKPLYPNEGTSPFYKAIMYGATNRFLEKYGVATFRFCTLSGNNHHSSSSYHEPVNVTKNVKPNTWCRGVTFPDLVYKSSRITMIPYGETPNHPSDSPPEINHDLKIILERVISIRTKPRAIIPATFNGKLETLNASVKNETPPKDDLFAPACVPPVIFFDETFDASDRASKEEFFDVLRAAMVENKPTMRAYEALASLKRSFSNHIAKRSDNGRSRYDDATRSTRDVTSPEKSIRMYFSDCFVTKERCRGLFEHILPVMSRVKCFDYCLEIHSNRMSMWQLTFYI